MFNLAHTLKLVEMRLQETGTFNPNYIRPYYADINSYTLDNLSKGIEQIVRTRGNGEVSSGFLAGKTDGLITVSAAPERAIDIVNGWGERRLRFILEVHLESAYGTEIYYFQGYSEYYDMTLQSGIINPKMAFFINSYTRVNRSSDPSNPMGGYMDRVLESYQVLNGRFVASQVENTNILGQPNLSTTPAERVLGARPMDLVVGIQSNSLFQNVNNYTSDAINIDTRVGQGNQVFQSGRSAHIPSQMLAKVINTYRNAQTLIDYGQGAENIYDRVIQSNWEQNPYENAFIRTLSDQKGMPEAVNWFTLEDLALIDPTIGTRTHYSPLADQYQVHNVGYSNTEGWGGSNLQTQIAALTVNTVGSLMQACGLVSVYFTATNMTSIGTEPDVRMLAPGIVISTANPVDAYNLFLQRFKTEVLPDLTKNNQIPIAIRVEADAYNETRVTVGVDIEAPVDYAFPAFCDALTQPTMTTSRDNWNGLVSGIEQIMNYCGLENTMPAQGVVEI